MIPAKKRGLEPWHVPESPSQLGEREAQSHQTKRFGGPAPDAVFFCAGLLRQIEGMRHRLLCDQQRELDAVLDRLRVLSARQDTLQTQLQADSHLLSSARANYQNIQTLHETMYAPSVYGPASWIPPALSTALKAGCTALLSDAERRVLDTTALLAANEAQRIAAEQERSRITGVRHAVGRAI